jgi:hypothetical protein
VDDHPVDELQDLVRVPDLVDVRPGPGLERSKESKAVKRAKFLLSMDLVVGATLSTDMDTMTGKWSVVASESTLTVASRSWVMQMWLRTDWCPLASPSSLTCWP